MCNPGSWAYELAKPKIRKNKNRCCKREGVNSGNNTAFRKPGLQKFDEWPESLIRALNKSPSLDFCIHQTKPHLRHAGLAFVL